MSDTLKYDLVIHHLENGNTKLNTPLHWSEYDSKGEIINAGVNGYTEFPIPLPSRIMVKGNPKRSVGKVGIKSILRSDCDEREMVMFETLDTNKPLSPEHEELFDRLKAVMNDFAPDDGQFILNLHFLPDDPTDETECVDTDEGEQELAALLALLHFMTKPH
ncbi:MULTISPECIES: hypothetical protein [Pantoea]|uniref:Uncharacterized protein n=1 Tax=Candidatus Pantoea floridensis TaxID=1938870 RepID=A0A286BZY7_9GAMM|nr:MULTISPECIES: hypothetical protein [Pantoea]PIF22203.1 hypothetical protein BX596_1612 [Enterobacteriaceae bacterium JKS000233]PXW18513.1 hypothetical protein BY447_0066 [Pantoea sp. JKS000250]SOD39710.1 hypothetical protein SAMN06273570_4164 [Pantoea floridensis]